MSFWNKLRKGRGSMPEEGMDLLIEPLRATIPELARLPKAEVASAIIELIDNGFMDLHFKLYADQLSIRLRMKAPGMRPTRWEYIDVPLVATN